MGKIQMGTEVFDIERPTTGFAQHMLHTPSRTSALFDERTEPQSLTKERSPYVGRGRGTTLIEWPKIVVERAIAKAPGSDWESFNEKFDHATRRYGVATKLGEMSCVYITNEEFGTMLTKAYPEVARDTHAGRAIRVAREVTGRFNETLKAIKYNSARDQELRDVWDDAIIWQPTKVEVAPQLEGAGPRFTVLPLVDEFGQFAKERQTMLDILSGQDFRFNVSAVNPDWEPSVVVLDNNGTHQPRKTSFRTPEYPLLMPFDSPKAIVQK